MGRRPWLRSSYIWMSLFVVLLVSTSLVSLSEAFEIHLFNNAQEQPLRDDGLATNEEIHNDKREGGNDTVVCRFVSGGVECNGETYQKEEEDSPPSAQFFQDLGVSIGLTLMAGMMSGLTMGLMSIDLMNLQILASSGSPSQRTYAKRIMPLVKRHHLLLVTLLVCNAAAMEALPIFLDRLLGPIFAIIVSVTCILFFGEIIPQAICTRFGLAIGGHLFWFVWILVIITFPVSWPISLLLDCLLGDSHATYFRRAELKELVHLHGKHHHHSGSINNDHKTKKDAQHGDLEAQDDGLDALSPDEVTIIHGAVDMKLKTASDALTTVDDVFMLDVTDKMGEQTMDRLLEEGYSRVPVYRKNRQNILGMILVKTLIKLNPADDVPVNDLEIHRLPIVDSNLPLFEVLNLFQKGHSHMALVIDSKDHLTVRGIITMEDVIEELIQEEIVDETDLTAVHTPYLPLPGRTIPIAGQPTLAAHSYKVDESGELSKQHLVGSLLRGSISNMRMSQTGLHIRTRSERSPLLAKKDHHPKDDEEDDDLDTYDSRSNE